ncbi:PAS domain S-box protein, partial [Myxococcota bacterium]|nr:PAS domain S-box protein [Myxococcota bacterium]
LAGVTPRSLPGVAMAGTVAGFLSPVAAAATGLEAGIPLIIAGGDQPCALLGAGIVSHGEALISLGTSAAVMIPVEDFSVPVEGSIMLPHVIPNHWVLEVFIGSFGVVLEQEARNLGFESVSALAEAASRRTISPGAPLWEPQQNVPVTALTTDADLGAALVFEGLSFGIARAVMAVEQQVGFGQLKTAGGGSRSPVLIETIAGVLDRPLTRCWEVDATLLGAAFLARAGAGLAESAVAAVNMAHIGGTEIVGPRSQTLVHRARLSWQKQGGQPMNRENDSGGKKDIFPLKVEALAQLRAEAMDFANVGIYRYRMDGTLVYIDDGVLRLLDIGDQVRDASEMFGRNIADLMQYVEEPRSLRSLTLEHGFVRDLEYHYRTLTGKDRWVYHSAFLVQNGQTGEEEFLVLARDITELKKKTLALAASEKRWKTLIESSHQGFVVCAGDPLRMILLNPALLQLLEQPKESLLDRNPQVLVQRFHPEDREAALARLSGQRERDPVPGRAELRVQVPGHEPKWVELRSSMIEYDGYPAVQTTVTDVTARVEALRERLEFEEQLHDAQRLESLGVLAGGVAHDFNNLLTTIIGNTELLRDGVTGSEQMELHVAEIFHAAEQAADLCRQLLDYSGRRKLSKQALDLNTLINDLPRLFDITVSRRVKLVRELTPGLPYMSGDFSQMRQVVMNLVTNASEALGSSSGLITVRTGEATLGKALLSRHIMGEHLLPGHYVFVEVEDDGCGMSEEVRKRIFEPFFSTKFTGRGLGLAAVRGIVRGHGGAFHVKSGPGIGTRIRVIFPVSPVQMISPKKSAGTSGAWRGSGTILLADDESAPRKITEKLLNAIGFECVCAEDGEEAIRLFQQDPDGFAMAVIDVMMPLCDGPACLRQLRRIRPDLPVLFISGFDDEALGTELSEPATAFLQKPFLLDGLREHLRRLSDQGSPPTDPLS